MVMFQGLIYLCAIFIALISLSRCGSVVTVTEDEAVQLEFPYPCDSNKVTIQSANRLLLYNSAEPESLFYRLNRFSVTDNNCSVQIEINPVKRRDKAMYICKAYRNGVINSEFTKIRLVVNYPPGNVACTFSINGDVVGDWVPLQCTAPIGSLAGGIYCYQDSKRLPPQSKLVQNSETLTKTIWARKEYPVFCCSSSLDQLKDKCECKDFVWNPMGNISHTKSMIGPCPATTPRPVATLSQYPEREVGDNPQLPHQLIESPSLTDTNKDKSTTNNVAALWGCVIVFGILVIIQVMVILRLLVEKAKTRLLVESAGTPSQSIEKQDFASQTYEKTTVLSTYSSYGKYRSKSLGANSKEDIWIRRDSTISKSASAMPMDLV